MVSLAQFEKPMKDAEKKLKSNEGASSHASSALTSASTELDGYYNQHTSDANKLAGNWKGPNGETYMLESAHPAKELNKASSWAKDTASKIDTASGVVKAAEKEVQSLIKEFEATAGPLVNAINACGKPGTGAYNTEASLMQLQQGVSPAQAMAIVQGMAAKYAKECADVVNAAKGRLSDLGSTGGSPGGTSPSSAGPIGSRDSGDSGGSGGGGYSGSGSAYSGGSGGSSGGGGGGGTGPAGGTAIKTPPSTQFGSGTQINLPQGLGTVNAPNERAAIAVRAALTQLGVPYVWGGNTPGKGLDCSGLTHWAYGQAGIDLPRLAQEQHIGQKVSVSDAQPGDLFVWNGHVAMYIGNGKLIEEPHTGEVCHIVPVRTSNAGDAFEGVYRPSA